MDIDDLKQLNSLWTKLYPYLASQIMEGYQRDSGAVLELGPFSGGISKELTKGYPGLSIIIAAESPAVLEYLREEMSRLSERINIVKTDLYHLPFEDSQFDLVIFRGAFFFLKEDLLQEIFRVLKDGGMAFVGGGFGKGVPKELIDEIADESRQLNSRLGRRWVSIEELHEIVRRSSLTDRCQIVEEGGVWLHIRR
ncbi:class I SAM-dependent methyltransferase [Chloroflexota bacterium]